MKTAILVDGGFYHRRAYTLFGAKSPEDRAIELATYCHKHMNYHGIKAAEDDLYRVFYYDCPPMDRKLFHPFLKRDVDFKKSDHYQWMNAFLAELKKKRKFALRLGKLSDTQACYTIKPDAIKKLCRGAIKVEDLKESDFRLNVEQKGVDMKIGIDIASLAYKKQVQRIILISGDSDFVPAAKLARREGIDFILDSMWATIKPELHEHIDGLRTCCPRPKMIEKQMTATVEKG